MKKMFCRAPFLGLSLTPDKSHVCCMNVNISIEQHRIDIYNNKIPDVCKQCLLKKDFENNKFDSIYEQNLKNFNLNTGKILDFKIGWLHIVNNWNCNCGCKICGTKNNLILDISEEIINNINYNSVKYITLQGGEIFLYPGRLEKIIKKISSNTFLHIITNGTIYNENILKLIKNRNNSVVTVSLDGINEKQEYMRPNGKYELVINNINKMQKYFEGKVPVNVNYTVSILNIFDVVDDLIQIKKDIKNNFYLNMNFVIQPFHYNISTLPKEIKEKILNIVSIPYILKSKEKNNLNKIIQLYKLYNSNILKDLIFLLKSEGKNIDIFKLYKEIKKNDDKYKLNINTINPIIKKYILSYNKAT